MRFALLGSDRDTIDMTRAAVAAGHELAWIGDLADGDHAAVAEFGRPSQPSQTWEELLAGQLAQFVIVGHGETPPDERIEQLKLLMAAAIPLLIVHPIHADLLHYYQLDMIRAENGSLVRHFGATAYHPLVAEMATWVTKGHPHIGAIQQIVMARALGERNRDEVVSQFARDIETLLRLDDSLDRISALSSAPGDAAYQGLNLQMSGRLAAVVRWSVVPPVQGPGAEITLVGERGQFSVSIPLDHSPWRTRLATSDKEEESHCAPFDAAADAVDRMVQAVTSADASRSTWRVATRAMEMADSIDLSLNKQGRPIDVYAQELTEQLAFKGTMSAVGCGLLVFGLLALVGVGVVDQFLRPETISPTSIPSPDGSVGPAMGLPSAEQESRKSILSLWPVFVLTLFVVFLLLQLVPVAMGMGTEKESVKTTGRK